MSTRRPRPLVVEPFDPRPSIEAALSLLEAAGASYALAGRLAVWAWVSADDQEFTKDVEFAVPAADMDALQREARRQGFSPMPLSIGGFGIRAEDKRIDFIDRRVDLSELFTEAVHAAGEQKTLTTTESGREVPGTPLEYVVAMNAAAAGSLRSLAPRRPGPRRSHQQQCLPC